MLKYIISNYKKIKWIIFKNKTDGLIDYGKDAYINPSSFVHAKTVIGDHTLINGKIIIKGNEPVEFGKYCAVGDGVRIISSNHLVTYPNMQITLHDKCGFKKIAADNKGTIHIGNGVWIGDSVIILPGINVGSGAVIGAGSVVTKDVPPFSIVAGVPGKVIRKRFSDDVITALLDIKWWDWSIEQIKRNKQFFETDLSNISAAEFKKIIVS